MPRGTQKTEEQRIQFLEEQITEMESRKAKINEKIKELNEQKQAILDSQQQKKLEEIQKFILKSNKTPDEILEMLKTAG